MKILVLGSEGQIGQPTVEVLKANNITPICWDIELSPEQDLRFYNKELEERVAESDFVYYFASDVGGSKYLSSHEHTFNFIKNNMDIMSNVFSVLKKTQTPFIFTSSQMADLSFSTYGQLKKIGETLTKDIGGLPVRLWNVYGIDRIEEKSHVVTDFCKMAKYNKQISMRTNGLESRQMLYVKDFVNCLLKLTEVYSTLDKTKNYHITNFEWIKILDIAHIIQKFTNCEIISCNKQDDTQKNTMSEPDNFILNYWKPTYSIEQGLKEILEVI